MCQYDLGYNLYCTNIECQNVDFVIQEQFLETFPVCKRLFAKHKRPCDCRDKWYRWHYYATQSGRYKHPFVKLCTDCVQERRAEVRKGNLTENIKPWIKWKYPTNRREPYPRNGKPPISLHKGFIQEYDIDSGLSKTEGRVINRFAYNSDDGTSVSGKTTPRVKPSTLQQEIAGTQMHYLEDAERPTRPVTVLQPDGERPDVDNASDICMEASDDGFDAGNGKCKATEPSREPPKDFHKIEDKDWITTRAELLNIFAKYSAKVDRADAKLEDQRVMRDQESVAAGEPENVADSGSETEHDDGRTESSVVSSSIVSHSTTTSVESYRRARAGEDYTDDEYEGESESEASSALAGLQIRDRR